MTKYLQFLLVNLFRLLIVLLLLGTLVACYGYFYIKYKLPDVETLKDKHMQVPMKVYTSDGKLIGEYGEIRRIPVQLNEVPRKLIAAVLATEDQRFYEHPGIDPIGIVRAIKQLVVTGRKEQGASTITMQVARNFFLGREKTYSRKINEMLLALMIDHNFSKDKILELYLNKIYLGNRAYGVAAAARIYYDKNLNDLTLAEMAMIAGLAQAPSANNPLTNPKAATERRDHVLARMLEHGDITRQEYDAALVEPLKASYYGTKIQAQAPYLAEMARQALYDKYGDAAYSEGFNVYTTVDSKIQNFANESLWSGLMAYDRRHGGYRGHTVNLGVPSADTQKAWASQLRKIPTIGCLKAVALLTVEKDGSATALTRDQKVIDIPAAGLAYGKRTGRKLGPLLAHRSGNIFQPGDVIRVFKTSKGWELGQVPQAESALVSINPMNGALIAVVGGFDFENSKYNRVTQSSLQPGSNFKPFIYSAALAQGFTLASIVNDSPIEIRVPGTGQVWRPQNHDHKFNGPTRLREGLVRSLNLVSIRLLEAIGVTNAIDYLTRFGFDPKNLPHNLTLALGTAQVTPLEMVDAYATFANGGYHVTPFFIEHITNLNSDVIYKAEPKLACPGCNDIDALNPQIPAPEQIAPQVISPQNAFQMNSVLQDVIRKGTGRAALKLNRNDLAGKTGTTNDQIDAWFSGYNADVSTTVWVGFDKPRSTKEYGAQAALPIWMLFMNKALEGLPDHTTPEPPGMVYVRIDPSSGRRLPAGMTGGIFEVFPTQFEPDYDEMMDTQDNPTAPDQGDIYQDNSDGEHGQQLF